MPERPPLKPIERADDEWKNNFAYYVRMTHEHAVLAANRSLPARTRKLREGVHEVTRRGLFTFICKNAGGLDAEAQ